MHTTTYTHTPAYMHTRMQLHTYIWNKFTRENFLEPYHTLTGTHRTLKPTLDVVAWKMVRWPYQGQVHIYPSPCLTLSWVSLESHLTRSICPSFLRGDSQNSKSIHTSQMRSSPTSWVWDSKTETEAAQGRQEWRQVLLPVCGGLEGVGCLAWTNHHPFISTAYVWFRENLHRLFYYKYVHFRRTFTVGLSRTLTRVQLCKGLPCLLDAQSQGRSYGKTWGFRYLAFEDPVSKDLTCRGNSWGS